MYTFNQQGFTRPHSVDRRVDRFIKTDYSVSDAAVLELVAYYRGEPVTEWLVELGRGCYCERCPPPLPFRSLGNVSFKCTDSKWDSKIDIGTLCRHYELISDLYDFDPTVREVSLPFTRETVENVMSFEVACLLYQAEGELLECLMFLRPKRTETYLQFKWPTMSEDFARFIGRGLEKETRMHLSKFARVFPDEELYPILQWAVTLGQRGVLYSLLKVKAPSVLLWCLANGESSGRREQYAYDIVTLIRECDFTDQVQVMRPWRMCWDLGDGEPEESIEKIKYDVPKRLRKACWLALRESTDSSDYRRLLAAFRIRSRSLENEEVVVHIPFDMPISSYHRSRQVVSTLLERLRAIDATFTIEMEGRVMDEIYARTWSRIGLGDDEE